MIHQIKTIEQFYKLRNLPPPGNPLISVVDIAAAPVYEQIESGSVVFGFYVISFKSGRKANAGQSRPQNNDGGVLGFRAPGQVVKIEPNKPVKSITSGWMLCIHPDFFWHTPLAKKIRSYDFFYYDLNNEALFLSDEEQTTINTLVANVSCEFQKTTDKFSQEITIALIEALLGYIERFYQRQFTTNKVASHQLLDKLDYLLNQYFDNEKLSKAGLPTVAGVAEELNISPHYLSAMLRSITGKNAQQHIHEKLITKAKELLSTTDLSVSETAYTLGFEHLQSFSRLFKSKTNLSPLEFRSSFD